MKEYKFINGTAYHVETSNRVINILENIRNSKKRVRIFYGDPKTGRDWLEEYDTIGYIGRSAGKIKIPLLIKNSRSIGGGGILDNCIIKITMNKKTIYQHPKYTLGELQIKKENENYAVYRDNENIANFETKKQAENYIKFLKGIRNRR